MTQRKDLDEVRDLLGNLDYRISKFQENLNKLNNAKVADKNTHLESFKHELNKADDSVTTIKNRIKSCPPDSITDPNCKSITSPFKALSKYSTYCHLY